MNIVWTVATAVSLAVLMFVAPDKFLSVFIDGAETAVGFGVKLIAVYCVWLGIFEIADRCNAVQKLAKLLAPINRLLYGKIEAEAANYIALNEASNLLGVGNAATPSAIEAIRRLEHGETLSRAGAVLFVVNASGVQLVPTTVIGLRAQAGSASPSDILLPTFISTVLTAVVGIALVCLAYPKRNEKTDTYRQSDDGNVNLAGKITAENGCLASENGVKTASKSMEKTNVGAG